MYKKNLTKRLIKKYIISVCMFYVHAKSASPNCTVENSTLSRPGHGFCVILNEKIIALVLKNLTMRFSYA